MEQEAKSSVEREQVRRDAPYTKLFADNASLQAIKHELKDARWAVVVAKKRVHSLECLYERREMEIADGTWPRGVSHG